ncbi:phenylacetate--CoA ligase family protein [Desulfovibrio inopinatus]|uniref:phenylacetate--CoA ligase family protein n=1 Tax=Desulfovibrio inopinatus TaxID=102109 RepID=UPI0003FC1211|nr:phenylacetate--CoA ligase [Desulfovibrio inopinatus]
MVLEAAQRLTRDAISQCQLARFNTVLKRAVRSPFYADRLGEVGATDVPLPSLDHVNDLPFTTKDDLRASYPHGMLAVPKEHLVRMHASSGTTGTPTAIFHTQNDLNSWAELMARCMHMVGLRPSDVFINMSGYGLFTGGLGIHNGAERLGCLTIPSGAGNSRRQIKLIEDFQATAVHIIPSYALHLASVISDMGRNPADLSLRIALIGAEPHTDGIRRRIEELYGVKAYNSYGLSEMNGPGVAFECEYQDGLHVWEDAFYLEVINPETGEVLPDGELGELVLTSLCREGMPIIRYRTRDLTRILPEPCPCGRVHRRIERIAGRSDDMMIVKGVNIYPMQIERVLMQIGEVGDNYVIERYRDGFMDNIRVRVEVREEFFVEDMRALTGLQKRISSSLRDEILITPKVELVEPKSLPKSEGKAHRVVDLREDNA